MHIMTGEIRVTINSDSLIKILSSPSHHLHTNYSTDRKSAVVLVDADTSSISHIFAKNFVLYIQSEDVFEPQFVVAKHPSYKNDYVAHLSFFPNLNSFSTESALELLSHSSIEEMYKASLQEDLKTSRGDFIFVLDRSGSMHGQRIADLRRAMFAFLGTLPEDSYFNIISYGSSYTLLYTQSQPASSENLAYASSQVEMFESNLGGTEILDPLQAALKSGCGKPGYPKKIFLLTDGNVYNSNSILDFVKSNSHNARFCSVGIRNGVSPFLISEIGKLGRCGHEFVEDSNDLTKKAMRLMENSISHFIDDITIKLQNFEQLTGVKTIPALNSIPMIQKNERFELWLQFSLPEGAHAANPTVEISYTNSYTKLNEVHLVDIPIEEAYTTGVFHKLLAQKQIEQIESTKPYSRPLDSVSKREIVELSVKYQVLSEETAFLCVMTDAPDSPEQRLEIEPEALTKVVIPSVKSADYEFSGPPAKKQGYRQSTCILLMLVVSLLMYFGL